MARPLHPEVPGAGGLRPPGAGPTTGAAPDQARAPATDTASPPALVVARAAVVLILAVGLALGLLAAAAVVPAAPQADADLARLLRAMVGVKGLILAAAAALVLWRLGRPVRPMIGIGYALALGAAAAAIGWLWGIATLPDARPFGVPLGSGLFWGGLVALYLVVRRDPGLFVRDQPARLRRGPTRTVPRDPARDADPQPDQQAPVAGRPDAADPR